MTNTNDKQIIGNPRNGRNTIGDVRDDPMFNDIMKWNSSKVSKPVVSSVPSVPINGTADDSTSPMDVTDPEKYLILPGRTHGSYEYPDMMVSMEKEHLGKNWGDTQTALFHDGVYMLTIRQFADFLQLLKSGSAYDGKGNKVNKKVLNNVLNEIVRVRNPWRAEWLDARFDNGNIGYHVLKGSSPNYNLVQVVEPLNNYLNSDKVPGISLDDWIAKSNSQGLPILKTKKGRLHYWAPDDGGVAWFYAGSDGTDLNCGADPTYTISSLGVRIARPVDGVK